MKDEIKMIGPWKITNHVEDTAYKVNEILSKLNAIEQRLEKLENAQKSPKSVSDFMLEHHENKE